MKIGLLDIDGHNYPNLALMKISAWHKQQGDNVEFINHFFQYDRVYKSKVFTHTKDDLTFVNSIEIIKGGTGYNLNILEDKIEHTYPDYELYKENKAYGFLTRGCVNKCYFCVVPQKEGMICPNADIEEFWNKQEVAILMDNNVLAHGWGLKQIEKIINLKIKVDFNQGLDARIISTNPQIAQLLSRVKWHKPIRMACDSDSQIEPVIKATELLRRFDTKPSTFFIYVLVKDIDNALGRIEILRKHKLDPFAQPLITEKVKPTKSQKHFARWVNHKAIFKSVKWEDYK